MYAFALVYLSKETHTTVPESYFESCQYLILWPWAKFLSALQATHLLYRNRNLRYLGTLWSLINIWRILWSAQRKHITKMGSFSDCTNTLPIKTFYEPYPEAGIRDHRLHILFNLLCSSCYQLHAWVEAITVQFSPFVCFCKQIETMKKTRKHCLILTLRAPVGSPLCSSWHFWLFP